MRQLIILRPVERLASVTTRTQRDDREWQEIEKLEPIKRTLLVMCEQQLYAGIGVRHLLALVARR